MTPMVWGCTTAVAAEAMAASVFGIPDWLAGILMILGMIFLIAIIPLAVLFGICFECRRR